jgi:phage repressor protein C with HTH and peptisase S24 domain
MPAAVVCIQRNARPGFWSLLELAQPGEKPRPLGILFVDRTTDRLTTRLLNSSAFDDLEEREIDILDFLAGDLQSKADERGAAAVLGSLEDSLSGFLRIGDRTEIEYNGSPERTADRLFDEYVDNEVQPYVTHLPLYGLRAAATKFGEGMESSLEEWVRVDTGRVRPTSDMFVARVVGRSMEPLIPDDSLCIFRAGVTGSRQGKRVLIEKFGETDFASRYTVKRYTSHKSYDSEGNWQHEEIRLEPLNPEFESFTLGPDEFRVIAEFVEVLHS